MVIFFIFTFNGVFSQSNINIIETYTSMIGIRELTGNNDGEEVQKILSYSGLSGNYPWCSAFINYVFILNGIDLNLKYPAYVPSYFPKDKLIYVRGQYKLREPIYGDLIGIYFKSKGRLSHIGFYDGQTEKYYISVEGNTNGVGSREGDGVYRKKRIKRQVHSISNWLD
jgi:hypothetical protein